MYLYLYPVPFYAVFYYGLLFWFKCHVRKLITLQEWLLKIWLITGQIVINISFQNIVSNRKVVSFTDTLFLRSTRNYSVECLHFTAHYISVKKNQDRCKKHNVAPFRGR